MDVRELKVNFDEVVRRRRAFYEGGMKDRILFSVEQLVRCPYPDRPRSYYDLGLKLPPPGTSLAGPVEAEVLAPLYAGFFSQYREVCDDRLPICEVLGAIGHGLICDVLNHPINIVSLGGHSGSVVEPQLKSVDDAIALVYDGESAAVKRVRHYLRYIVEYGGSLPGPYMMTDGLHVLTMLFGYDKAYMMLYEDPEGVHAFCRKMVDVNIRFFDMQYDAVGSVAGGWVCTRSDWNPVRCISMNLDDYLCCSNEILQEFGGPYMQQMIDHFGVGLIHYHTSDVRLLKEVNKLRNIHVQIGSEPRLAEPVDCIEAIRRVLPEAPVTWMRIRRDDFVERMRKKRLWGNMEYYVSGVRDVEDANELAKRSKEYVASYNS